MFETASALPDPGFLLTLTPGRKRFGRFRLSFPEKGGGWEPVELLPSKDDPWCIRWKVHRKKETVFEYYRFSPASSVVTEITEEEFRPAYVFKTGEQIPRRLAAVMVEMSGSVSPERNEKEPLVHLIVRYPGYTCPERYRIGSPDLLRETEAAFLRIPGFKRKNVRYLLAPHERVYVIPESGEHYTIGLPELPDGFIYTDLWSDGKFLLVAWEERRFPDVGRAGIVSVTVADQRIAGH
jgi:hypothetical protein